VGIALCGFSLLVAKFGHNQANLFISNVGWQGVLERLQGSHPQIGAGLFDAGQFGFFNPLRLKL
jgi:hypothetical protein